MKIGVQLYTLRETCRNLKDFAETLDRVADMGYTTVQVSGTCDYEAEWLAEQLKRTGLTCDLTHYKFDKLTTVPDEVVEFHNKFNCKYIGLGCMPDQYRGTQEGYDAFISTIRNTGKRIHELGSYFTYHNHDFEYSKAPDGRTYMEMLSDDFSPEELGFTLDTYWIKYGGGDPISEIKRLSGRIPCVHFKDMEITADGTRRFSWVGGGVLNFEEIIAALETTGTEFAYIEQDDCFGADPFDCVKKSYDYLASLGLR